VLDRKVGTPLTVEGCHHKALNLGRACEAITVLEGVVVGNVVWETPIPVQQRVEPWFTNNEESMPSVPYRRRVVPQSLEEFRGEQKPVAGSGIVEHQCTFLNVIQI
jgi:hypothetical protein